MNIVISQSMYFPWVGMLEQIKLADVFVHYDDVQFSKGSFTNRVQIKQQDGSTAWMTVPLKNLKLGQQIDEVEFQDSGKWLAKHRAMLENSFSEAAFAQDALDLAEQVWTGADSTIADLARSSLLAMSHYFALDLDTRFIDCTSLGIEGSSSQRVLDIVKALGGNRYITGHGAFAYLDHELFEQAGIEVLYMEYQRKPYPQSHGAFTPYVSALDLIANAGHSGIEFITSKPVYWRDFSK